MRNLECEKAKHLFFRGFPFKYLVTPSWCFHPVKPESCEEDNRKGTVMHMPSKSDRAYAALFAPPLPDGVLADKAVIIRYDGVRIGAENVIYAVLGSEDLSRLPSEVLDGLEFSVMDADGELRGSPSAFFIGSERHLSLYVDVDAYPEFIDQVKTATFGRGLTLLNGEGDLRSMMGPDGDISAPAVPAFIENGMGYVPSLLAMSHLDRIRPDHEPYSGPELG